MRSISAVMVVVLGSATACKPGGLTSDDESSESTSESTGDGGSGTSGDESTDSESTETGDEVPPCEPPMLDSCWSGVTSDLDACVEACSCDDIDCAADCHEVLNTDYWGCVDQYCQEPWSDTCAECYSTLQCEDVCETRRSSCLADGCDSNICNYQRMSCNVSCYVCINLYFEFAWADSCELVLPGPPAGIGEAYVTFSIGGQQWWLGEPGLACGDPEAADVIWADESRDRLLLCNRACEAFATSGVAEVQYGCPPG